MPDPAPAGSSRPIWLAIAVFVVLSGLFAITAEWGLDQNVDAVAAALPASSLAETGSVVLDEFAAVNPWVGETSLGLVSNRPPGVWAHATVTYLFVRPFTVGFEVWPATLTAVLTTAAASAANWDSVRWPLNCRT